MVLVCGCVKGFEGVEWWSGDKVIVVFYEWGDVFVGSLRWVGFWLVMEGGSWRVVVYGEDRGDIGWGEDNWGCYLG